VNHPTSEINVGRSTRRWQFVDRTNAVAAKYGLLFLLAALFIGFSIALPHTFPTSYNIRIIASQNCIVLIVVLALVPSLAAGAFDLSIGYQFGLAEVLMCGFMVNQHLSWPVAALIVLLVGAALGTISGLIVALLEIDSFIATLGTGSVILAVGLYYDKSAQIIGNIPSGFKSLGALGIGGIPNTVFFALGVLLVLWLLLDFTPFGRHLYVLGTSPRTAELLGIRRKRYIPIVLAIGGLLCALAGILEASQLQVGQPNIGPEYLLPAFSAAMLGATAIKVGRVNPWGATIGAFVIAVGQSGLIQYGAGDASQSLFNGLVLLVAMAIAGITARRRLKAIPGTRGNSGEAPVGTPIDTDVETAAVAAGELASDASTLQSGT
jgi:ribose transport system permease protein